MPVLHTSFTCVTISGTTGCVMETNDSGSTIRYNGVITLNGKVIESPNQLLTKWKYLGDMYLKDAEESAGLAASQGFHFHFAARGRASAYAMGVLALETAPDAERAVTLLKASIMGAENASDANPDMGDMAKHGAKELLKRAQSLLAELETTASVTWIDQ